MSSRSVLICSHCLPQADRDSGSLRLLHFVEFLRAEDWSVTCIARDRKGISACAQTREDLGAQALEDMGVAVHVGFKEVEELATRERFDVAIFGFCSIAHGLMERVRRCSPCTRLIVDSGDVHFLRNARRILGAPAPLGRLDAHFGTQVVNEINVYAAADSVLTVSQKEADLINDLVGKPDRAHTVPDCEDLVPSQLPFEQRRGMFMVGNFEHPPNLEALQFLCGAILPQLGPEVLAAHPLYMVGNAMSEEVRQVGAGIPGVRMVGWVPSVVPYLERVRLSLAPLLHGAGTKRKMIQALAMGTPTVATSIAVEGLDLRDEEDVLVADDPVAYANAMVRLLADRDLWEKLSSQGVERINARHSREYARASLLRVIDKVLLWPRSPRPSRGKKGVRTLSTDVELIPESKAAASAERVLTPLLPTKSTRRMTVVIPTHNRAQLLDQALASLSRQSVGSESFEVMVVDDGSADNTAEVCRQWGKHLFLDYQRIEHAGTAAAKNAGIRAASAPLLFFFDDDDIAAENLLAEHLRTHARYPLENAAVLGYTDWASTLEVSPVMRFITDVGLYLFAYSYVADGERRGFEFFWSGRLSCKKSLLDRLGLFHDKFVFGCEDIELGFRLSKLLVKERLRSSAFDIGDDDSDARKLLKDFGVAVIFNRRAVQHMNRPITFDEFCARCERQGRAQGRFSRLHTDGVIQRYCQIVGVPERWQQVKPLLDEKVTRVHELEALFKSDTAGRDRKAFLAELHELYRWTFDAFKTKGLYSYFEGEASR